MSTDGLIGAVSALVVLSGSAERLVEILKGFFPKLNIAKTDPVAEGKRKAVVQLITLACCVLTAILAHDLIAGTLWGDASLDFDRDVRWFAIIGLGALAAGGSSLWNSILTYFVSVKDVKRAEATDRRIEVQQRTADVADPTLPGSMPPTGSQTL